MLSYSIRSSGEGTPAKSRNSWLNLLGTHGTLANVVTTATVAETALQQCLVPQWLHTVDGKAAVFGPSAQRLTSALDMVHCSVGDMAQVFIVTTAAELVSNSRLLTVLRSCARRQQALEGGIACHRLSSQAAAVVDSVIDCLVKLLSPSAVDAGVDTQRVKHPPTALPGATVDVGLRHVYA
ncbi:hypothetical protein JG687_00015771, partial [Phytophthora cactorum]